MCVILWKTVWKLLLNIGNCWRWVYYSWIWRFNDVRGLTSRTLHRPKNLILTKNHWHEFYFFLKTTKPKAVPLSSKRGTPPFKIYYIGKLFAPCKALWLPPQFRNLLLSIFNLLFCEASGIWELASGIYISHFSLRISHLQDTEPRSLRGGGFWTL